ncbi:hypothetical protein JCM9533A_67800 [Catenuloplanes niger JCM 9533]
MPKNHALLYASAAAWIGVAVVQIRGDLRVSVTAAVLTCVVTGAASIALAGAPRNFRLRR